MIENAVTVSIISMSVIFLVLTVLIFTINLLVKLIPYKAPPAKPAKRSSAPAAATASADEDEHIAAISGAMTAHLGQNPGSLDIKPL